MSNVKKFIVFFLILSGTICFATEKIVEAIVAIVNDDVITLSQYKQQHDALYEMLRMQYKSDEFDNHYSQVKKELLDSMITEILLLQEAKKKDLNVTDQVNMYIENLKKQNNIETDEQLRQAIQQQGVNFDDWKKRQEENILKQAVIFTEVDKSIVIDETEMLNYYKQHPEEFTELPEYRIRAIYLSAEKKIASELQAKMSEIDQKIASGEDFAALAAQYSEGPGKESQGDLGTFKKGEMERALEEPVEKLNVGGLTPWIQTANGWYLVRLEEKKESRLKDFEEVRKEIEENLFEMQSQKKQQEFIDKLKENSYIKILIPNPFEY